MADLLVTVVICTYNRAPLFQNAISSLTGQETPEGIDLEIVVVDDRSTDNTRQIVEVCQKNHQNIRYVVGEGKGVARALELGRLQASGSWIAFFDDDQTTHNRWITSLINAAISGDAQIAGGPIRLTAKPSVLAGIGPVCRTMYGEHPRQSAGPFRRNPLLPGGGNRLVEACVFDQIGGFDTSIRTGGADQEFIVRAQLAGIRFAWSDDAWIEHLILKDRLETDWLQSYCFQAGYANALIDLKHFGWRATILMATARAIKELMIDRPVLAAAILQRSLISKRDQLARIAIAKGYRKRLIFSAIQKLGIQQIKQDPSFRSLRD